MNPLRRLIFCLQILTAGYLSGIGRAQDDNFDDGNDTGWTRFAPLGPLGGTSYSVSGGSYKLACDPSPNESQYGPARCGALRIDRDYSQFLVMVDFKDWVATEDSSIGVLARIQPGPAPGAVNGYSFTWQSKDGDVQISRITGEVPTNISGSTDLVLPEGGTYRLVFFGNGSHLEGRIYDMSNPAVPLITTVATDETYAEGICGIVLFADENTRTSASFDNYSASDGTPPLADIVLVNNVVRVSWPTARGLVYDLLSSTDLVEWWPVGGLTYQNGRTVASEQVLPGVSSKFFRLGFGPTPP